MVVKKLPSWGFQFRVLGDGPFEPLQTLVENSQCLPIHPWIGPGTCFQQAQGFECESLSVKRLFSKLRNPKESKTFTRFFKGEDVGGGPHALTSRNIYILPTIDGLIFLFATFAILLGSLNYQTSLGFALSIVLFSLWIISALHTHRTLARLTLLVHDAKPVSAGEYPSFLVQCSNLDGPKRSSLFLHGVGDEPLLFDLGNGEEFISLRVPPYPRGVHTLGRVKIETRYPLNFFKAWSPFVSRAKLVVYPLAAPKGLPLPRVFRSGSGQEEAVVTSSRANTGDFKGVGEYKIGDSPRRIHWKASARLESLAVKEFEGVAGGEVELRYAALMGQNSEARLSQLCRWVFDSFEEGVSYSLELPDSSIPRGAGENHLQKCLLALARCKP
jgi:uncharacterized protein (DUF58 family)